MGLNESAKLHPRNRHSGRYDFAALSQNLPEIKKFIIKNKYSGEDTIDFSNAEAVKNLNKAILKSFYNVQSWDIPKDFLCPPIPGRTDYIHYAADLLQSITKNTKVRVLDIGVGANAVFPLIGHAEYGWSFVGTDIDPISIASAKKNIEENNLSSFIEIRQQIEKNHIFTGIVLAREKFDLTICNPPFHASAEAAALGTQRKNDNLKTKTKLNFGGKNNELWCEGGESEFIRKMIYESWDFKDSITWFSTLVSKKENLSSIYGELKRIGVKNVKTFEMAQGQKQSRFVAWSFHDGLK